MNKLDLLEKLSAMSGEIANISDLIVDGMGKHYDALRTLNGMQSGISHMESLVLAAIRDEEKTIPEKSGISDIAEIGNTGETLDASRHGPQAQVNRETVTPTGELVSGVGDGTDAGEAPGDQGTLAAQSVQAVAETAPVEPGAAPDRSPEDRVLELWESGELTANEITERTFIGSSIVLKILRKARSVGDPRVVRGDLRKAEIADAKEKALQAIEATTPHLESLPAPLLDTAPQTSEPPEEDRGTVYEIQSTKLKTVRPETTAIGVALAFVSVRDGVVENGGQEVRVSGAPLRVIAKLNDQRLYTADELTEAGRYVSANVFRRNLNDVQRVLAQVGLHIVEYVSGGFQLRRVA